jgi:hypothetical protein
MRGTREWSLTGAAAALAAVAFVGMMGFQLLLALGFPLGRLAWGGESEVLPPGLRVGSLISALIFLGATVVVLERAEIIRGFGKPGLARRSTWFLVILFTFSAGLNFFVGGGGERRVMVPIALVLAALSLVVAVQPRVPSDPESVPPSP